MPIIFMEMAVGPVSRPFVSGQPRGLFKSFCYLFCGKDFSRAFGQAGKQSMIGSSVGGEPVPAFLSSVIVFSSDPYEWMEGLWRGVQPSFLSLNREQIQRYADLHVDPKFIEYHWSVVYPLVNDRRRFLQQRGYHSELGKGKLGDGNAMRKCILEGPYKLTTVTIPVVHATNDTLAIPKRTIVETLLTMSPENKAHYESEKEAIHLLLTGIGDEIYSTVDACKTAHEMWIAIERLQQGESLNIQDVKTNLFWEFGKFTSHDGESMESYYSRFYKMMNEMIRNNLTVATMQVNVQFLQQLQPEWSRFYQKEVNEIRAERIAKNANPLALVAAASPYPDPYYQAPKSHKPYAPTSKQSSSTRSNASTKFKGKEIAKPITPPSESASEEDSDPEQAQRDKDMQKNLALIAKYFKKIYKPTNNNLKTSSNSRNKNVDTSLRYKNDNQTGQFGNQRTVTVAGARETVGSQVVQQTGIQCFNCKEFGHFAKECRKPKRVKDSTYHKEKMLLCKQAEKGVPLQVEQSDWLADTDGEIDEQELEAHYSFMAKI
ncbi:retrovirus-related pol polyprotein from transposon TNT 1-94 [Tanacetum coccineum]